jgi:hypothetical protein
VRIYLDNCCLGRPFDDQTQDRVRLEAESVVIAMGHFWSGDWTWVASPAAYEENERDRDEKRRRAIRSLLQFVGSTVFLDQEDVDEAVNLQSLGFGHYDSFHLVAARKGRCDVFLTTDDRLREVLGYENT